MIDIKAVMILNKLDSIIKDNMIVTNFTITKIKI